EGGGAGAGAPGAVGALDVRDGVLLAAGAEAVGRGSANVAARVERRYEEAGAHEGAERSGAEAHVGGPEQPGAVGIGLAIGFVGGVGLALRRGAQCQRLKGERAGGRGPGGGAAIVAP